MLLDYTPAADQLEYSIRGQIRILHVPGQLQKQDPKTSIAWIVSAHLLITLKLKSYAKFNKCR